MEIPVYDTSDLDVLSEEASGVGLKRLDREFRERENLQASHRHNFYLIIWIVEGCGTHLIDFNAYPVKPWSLYFLSPGQVHGWNLIAETTGYIVAFTNEFFSRSRHDQTILSELPYFHTIDVEPVVYLDEPQAATIDHLIQNIEHEYDSSLLDRGEVLYAYLRLLLIQAKRLYSPSTTSCTAASGVLLVKKFRILIEANFLQQTSVSDYAKLLGITANHLNETVKATTGQTAGVLIRDRLLLEAKRLLIHSELSISEVAHQLNFEDPSYFSRFFKKYGYCSPRDFRKQSMKSTKTT